MKKLHISIFIIVIELLVPFTLSFQIDNTQVALHSEYFCSSLVFPKPAFTPKADYQTRKNALLEATKNSISFYAQIGRIYQGIAVDKNSIESAFSRIDELKDCADFRMNSLLRMMYLDKTAGVLNSTMKAELKQRILDFKYWYDEGGRQDSMIMWTENHEILFHTSELLAGQLYPNEVFTNSNMTGTEHITHALALLNRWFDWRGQFGFSEWHSNTYITEDIAPLVNLVDFANDAEIASKAAMVLDLIAFGFAMHYYDGRYATSHGRAYERSKVGTSKTDPANRESTTESAWIMVGIGSHNPGDGGNMGAVALATSQKYAPPPILEDIADDAENLLEHRERNSMDIADGPEYGIGYTQDDLHTWWPLSAPINTHTVDATIGICAKYNINPDIVYGGKIFTDIFQIAGTLRGVSLSEYCELAKAFTQGVCLEEANLYVYRTPDYQLAGVQDHSKGKNSMQKHIWQATLDEDAFVFANSPGIITQEFQTWVGGWSPRATLYKNVGIIQYDRESMPLELDFLISTASFLLDRSIIHIYFPKWAFNETRSQDGWTFGRKNDGYIALYSYQPGFWSSDYEIKILGRKNALIVEMGSKDEYGSFDEFVSKILQAQKNIVPQAFGYSVLYNSPLRGLVNVSWDGAMYVAGTEIDLGPYPRFDNKYCYQEFGTNKTTITFGSQQLVLDFDAGTRTYTS
jgi:hypothetical protein